MLTLRFDLRAPAFGAWPRTELYAAAIEMCAWAETRGAALVVLSEHHATDDNHLPAPLILASAIAARTERIGIMLAAVVLPFYDPVRLAEEMSVLDIISRGRVSYVLGIGHRPEEYEQFGIDIRRRGALADEKLALLRTLLDGQAHDVGGRRIHVTPPPSSPNGPGMLLGGGSVAAAERAGRYGLGLIAQSDRPGMREAYDEACRRAGHEPGFVQFPQAGAPTVVFVADDPDQAWAELGPHLLHDAITAASYRHGEDGVASISRAQTVEELRTVEGAYRVVTLDEAVEHLRGGGRYPLAPLCGGVSPAIAWPYLERATEALLARAQS